MLIFKKFSKIRIWDSSSF